MRKIGRVLGLRVDFLVREHRIISADALGDGYAFVEFGLAGGHIAILASGPPMKVLGHAELSAEDAKLLARAADLNAPTLSELDRVLLRLAQRACALQVSGPS